MAPTVGGRHAGGRKDAARRADRPFLLAAQIATLPAIGIVTFDALDLVL
jgi:hypothetical protein